MARRRFFVERVATGRATIRGEHARHLHHVLRVQPGQVFEISDLSRVYLGRVTASHSGAVEFAVEEELPAPAALPPVTLLASIFKFDRFEWMLEKATELGAAQVVPVIASRTDVKLAAAASKRVERWRRIAFEAAQQSRRLAPPEIADALPLEPGLSLETAPDARSRWMLDERPDAGSAGTRMTPADSSGCALLIGPEGGWTDSERKLAVEAGFQPVSLGPLILRAETAAIAALAVLLCAVPPPVEI